MSERGGLRLEGEGGRGKGRGRGKDWWGGTEWGSRMDHRPRF